MVKENFIAQSTQGNTTYSMNHRSYFTYSLTLLNGKRKFCSTKYTREHNVHKELFLLDSYIYQHSKKLTHSAIFYSTKKTKKSQSTQGIITLTLLTILHCLMVKESFVAQRTQREHNVHKESFLPHVYIYWHTNKNAMMKTHHGILKVFLINYFKLFIKSLP